MSGKVRNYYAGGNTAKGFYSFYDSALDGLDRVFILKGGPGTGKSSLMRAVGEKMVKEGLDIEYLHCSSDNNSIDGVIIRSLQVGIVDGTSPHVIEPKAPGAIEEYVNLGIAWDSTILRNNKSEIVKLSEQRDQQFQKAYATFAKALKAHDLLEKVYISNMNFNEANKLTGELIEEFYEDKKLEKKSNMTHRFLGAATPNGAINFIENLTDDIGKRYLIKGRAGSGKSTMLKKLTAEAENRGFDVEVYHCGFDPNSLDMLILRELDIAIFDSTAPHEYFPERESDEIVDMYDRCITPGTDEKYADEIEEHGKAYKNGMKEATGYLAEAKSIHEKMEEIYIKAMDYSKVEEIKQNIITEIEQLR
ncbi:PRK06851 family protein [Metabacillus fastidiosus]|uniref:PRK06851 family protein n=1 Tax=Metabacillus fastidiosus TaxID=1458 RepID=UPI002E23F730|nr:PRK06851 family protein [Metabacillus fastidiosus]